MRAADPFRKLYDVNQQRIRRLLARLVGPQNAEDLTQTVFAKAAAALPSFRGDAEPSTWLYRIATNVASDWLHSRSAHEANVTVPLPEALDDDARAAAIDAADVDTNPSPEQELSHRPDAWYQQSQRESEAAPGAPGVPQHHRSALRVLSERIVLQAELARMLAARARPLTAPCNFSVVLPV